MQKICLLIHTYIMQRRILKMHNKSKLTVTVKWGPDCNSKRGPEFINATTLNICQWTFDAVSIINVYETALTYMISVNTNDVQQSEITFHHICVASRIKPNVLLMAGACTYFINKTTTIA